MSVSEIETRIADLQNEKKKTEDELKSIEIHLKLLDIDDDYRYNKLINQKTQTEKLNAKINFELLYEFNSLNVKKIEELQLEITKLKNPTVPVPEISADEMWDWLVKIIIRDLCFRVKVNLETYKIPQNLIDTLDEDLRKRPLQYDYNKVIWFPMTFAPITNSNSKAEIICEISYDDGIIYSLKFEFMGDACDRKIIISERYDPNCVIARPLEKLGDFMDPKEYYYDC